MVNTKEDPNNEIVKKLTHKFSKDTSMVNQEIFNNLSINGASSDIIRSKQHTAKKNLAKDFRKKHKVLIQHYKKSKKHRTHENPYKLNTNKTGEENNTLSSFINTYKQEEKIAKLLNNEYYSSDDGGFNLKSGLNNFYIQGNTIFANSTRKSKIFKLEGDRLVDLGKKYREIHKVGKFYVGVNVSTKEHRRYDQKIDGSETYIVLDDNGNVMKTLSGHIAFNNKIQIYSEHDDSNNSKNIYDNNLDIISTNISTQTALLGYKNNQLFVYNSEDKKYYLLEKGAPRSDRIDDEKIIHNSKVFFERKENKDNQDEKREQERLTPLKFDIQFDGKTYLVKEIKSKSGQLFFKAGKVGDNWKIEAPYTLFSSNINDLSIKMAINKGLFILSKLDHAGNIIADKFINANGDKPIVIDFNDYAGYTFLEGNTIKHFINTHEAELYNIDGKKLGLMAYSINNEDTFQILKGDNGKIKLVENATGSIKGEAFDKILKTYEEGNKKVVIVENDGHVGAIEIKIY